MTGAPEHPAPLNETAELLSEFVHFSSPAHAKVLALTIAASYIADALPTVPYVFISSKRPGAGKTRALEVVSSLTRNPLLVSAATSGAVLRHLENALSNGERPTIFFDEIGAMIPRGRRASSDQARLESLLLSGNRRSGSALMSSALPGNAKGWRSHQFSTYGPKFFAGPEHALNDALMTRCLEVCMTGTDGPRPPRWLPESPALLRRNKGVVRRWRSWAAVEAERFRDFEVEDSLGGLLTDREWEKASTLLALSHQAPSEREVLEYQRAVVSVLRPGAQEARSALLKVAKALRSNKLDRISKADLESGSLVRSVRRIDERMVRAKEMKVLGTRSNIWGYKLAEIDSYLLSSSSACLYLDRPLSVTFCPSAAGASKPSKPTNQNIFARQILAQKAQQEEKTK